MTERGVSALVASIAWAGLALQFSATFDSAGSFLGTTWILLRFFTVLTNLVVAVVMTRGAIGRPCSASTLGGVTLAILLVGIVYLLLLRGTASLAGKAAIANVFLHDATPVLMALYWLGFARKGALRWRDPWLWALYPLAYFGYALARGQVEAIYPYPFMDVGRNGWTRTGLNALAIAGCFVLAGHALLGLDQALSRRGTPASGDPAA